MGQLLGGGAAHAFLLPCKSLSSPPRRRAPRWLLFVEEPGSV